MEINIIHNEDNLVTMYEHIDPMTVDLVLTSPPYNTSRKNSATAASNDRRRENYEVRYDSFDENMTNEEYIDWTVRIFNGFDRILKKNGCVLYNISYGSENVECMFRTVNDIMTRTNFALADCIIWKKKSALPNNVSPNKLTRIVEYVFVFCRKDEFSTFFCNKRVTGTREDNGQKMYENIFNFVEAANNDGVNPLNKATYSTELCMKLLDIYANPEGCLVYDPFMGTGTTAVAAKTMGLDYVGSEISAKQTEYAAQRLSRRRDKRDSDALF